MEQQRIAIPQLSFSKIIRDYIHGYIHLTNVEYELIQLPALNRLHNIKQLATAYLVYPCAKATRFEHSLGVMHIASRMFNQVLLSTSQEDLKTLFGLDPKENDKFQTTCLRLIQTVRLAALLHDIGHGPYSHATEGILGKSLDPTEIDEATKLFKCEKEKIPFHEYFSYKMITDEQSEIRKVIENNQLGVKAVDIGNVLLGKESTSIPHEGMGAIKKLISSQLDADRMDYLSRDAYATGAIFGQTDIDRVIMNLSIRKDKLGKFELAVHERALMTIEDILDARFKMYKWVYYHHLIVALDKLLETVISSMIEEKKIQYADFHWKTFLKGETDEALISSRIDLSDKNPYRGLIDRRYAPTSLLKRTADHANFIDMIKVEMGRETTNSAMVERIQKWLTKMNMGDFSLTIPQSKDFEALEKIQLLGVQRPRSPYKELDNTENIWVYNDTDGELKELITQSAYANAINNEWLTFPSYFIAFIIPNMKKDETKKYRKEILKLIASEIATI